VTEIDRNSVFLCRETYILNQLYIMVLYINYYGFKSFEMLFQNLKVLAFSFIKRQFIGKTDRNCIFLIIKPLFYSFGDSS
jgi:hypothetical protein